MFGGTALVIRTDSLVNFWIVFFSRSTPSCKILRFHKWKRTWILDPIVFVLFFFRNRRAGCHSKAPALSGCDIPNNGVTIPSSVKRRRECLQVAPSPPKSTFWARNQRWTALSHWALMSPSLKLWHSPPKPAHRALPAMGPDTSAPVVLSTGLKYFASVPDADFCSSEGLLSWISAGTGAGVWGVNSSGQVYAFHAP